MKIILVITNAKGKSKLFIADNLKSFSLQEAISLTKSGKIEDVHVVYSSKGYYLRSNPDSRPEDNLDAISVTENQVQQGCFNLAKLLFDKRLNLYEEIKNANIKANKPDAIIIEIKNKGTSKKVFTKTPQEVVSYIHQYSDIINQVAKSFSIDQNLLGAILIDEYCRLGWDDWFDWRAYFGHNASVGIAQVKLQTARDIITLGYYQPDGVKGNTKASIIYNYLKDPEYAMNFCAAEIKRRIDISKKNNIDISNKADYISYAYCTGKTPTPGEPEQISRCQQIKSDFYNLAKDALTQ